MNLVLSDLWDEGARMFPLDTSDACRCQLQKYNARSSLLQAGDARHELAQN